jgi:hypothetical protein
MNTDDSVWQKPKKKRKVSRKKKKEKSIEEETVVTEPVEEEIVVAEPIEEEIVTAEPVTDAEIHYPTVSSGVENINFGETNWEKETKYLKAFFTSPHKNIHYSNMKMAEDKKSFEEGKNVWLVFLIIGVIGLIVPPIGLITIMISGGGIYYYNNQLKALKTKKLRMNRQQRNWHSMNPEFLFSRLSAIEKQVAESSYHNLGIIKNAKPSEGGVIRPPAYCYGPHFSFDDFIRIDQTGYGKGAGYAKYCNLRGKDGWYSRTYDMMVVHFTTNQLLVYKCIFDCLEMTKTMEESYEWNYRHVVGINIMGDEEEKNVGGGFSLTGTKYLTISAASGDKIKIVLGAGTKQLDKQDGKTKRANIGGSERIFNVANSAMNNIRQAIREKAN